MEHLEWWKVGMNCFGWPKVTPGGMGVLSIVFIAGGGGGGGN